MRLKLFPNKLVIFFVLFVICNCYLFHSYLRLIQFRYFGKDLTFVTLCQARLNGNHRTGNHLFMLAAALDLAAKTNRKIIMPKKGWHLDNIFDFDQLEQIFSISDFKIHRYENKSQTCPCELIQSPHYDYDSRFNETKFLEKYSSAKNISISKLTLELCGLSQTYLHTLNPEVKKRLHALPRLLKDNAYDNAQEIIKVLKRLMTDEKLKSFDLYSYNGLKDNLTSYIPLKHHAGMLSQFKRGDVDEPFLVGVHVRMGDFLLKPQVAYGITVADDHYFMNAFDIFTKLYRKVIFVVLSDDIKLATKHFRDYFGIRNGTNNVTSRYETNYDDKDVKIIFFTDTLAQDFALLCQSDGLITSTGTFSWWAGWFNSEAIVVYYGNYPKPNSKLAKVFNKKNYYMKKWIPLQ